MVLVAAAVIASIGVGLGLGIGCMVLRNGTSEKSASSKAATTHTEKGILEELSDKYEEEKMKAILGMALFSANIYMNKKLEEEAAKKAVEEALDSATNEIGSTLGRTLCDILATLDIGNDIINNANEYSDSLQEYSTIPAVDNFWVPEKEGMPSIESIPAIPKEDNIIIDIPADDIPSSPIIDFPTPVKDDPVIIDVPADTGIDIPNVEVFPMPEEKSSDEFIFYINGEKVVFNSSNLSDVWKLGATERGDVVEAILAATEYREWYNIGETQGGYFPVIDFQKGNQVVSLKTLDPRLKSYTRDTATDKVIYYLDDLNRDITVDGSEADRILDIRIPEGTASYLDVDSIYELGDALNITVRIKEF